MEVHSAKGINTSEASVAVNQPFECGLTDLSLKKGKWPESNCRGGGLSVGCVEDREKNEHTRRSHKEMRTLSMIFKGFGLGPWECRQGLKTGMNNDLTVRMVPGQLPGSSTA